MSYYYRCLSGWRVSSSPANEPSGAIGAPPLATACVSENKKEDRGGGIWNHLNELY
jgi:hypothetical protein